jgi:hypothetical protein
MVDHERFSRHARELAPRQRHQKDAVPSQPGRIPRHRRRRAPERPRDLPMR